MARISKTELRDKIADGLLESESKFLIVEATHPFVFRIYSSSDADADIVDVRIYIWNCTHGGGEKRASDEYRIQITGTAPRAHSAAEVTLILGWHDALGVFAGFDIAHHDNQSASSSPSMQVKLGVLEEAADKGFSAHTRGNREIVVAFRPEYLAEYAKQRDALHKSTVGVTAFVQRLSQVTTLADAAINSEPDTERKEVLVQLRKKYRAADFRKRVLVAYRHRCAMCGSQLRLVEAAHILPVKIPGSDDSTQNGVALCVLHHRAFDATLISFDRTYEIEISRRRMLELRAQDLDQGAKDFAARVGKSLLLPNETANHPDPKYISAGRRARGWSA